MTHTQVVVNAKIGKIWKITTKYLKHYRMKYVTEVEKYDKFAFLVISFYRKAEYKIRDENVSLKDLDFEGQLKQMLQEEQKEI